MTDEAYVFNETNRERAITKKSAFHKRSGARGKTCKLGVDKMSNAEIKAKHGEVKTWKLTEFYTYEEFKQMPKDLQVEYLNYLMDTYNIGLATISRDLFNLSAKSLNVYVHRSGINNKLKGVKCGARASHKQIEWFKNYISEIRNEKSTEEVPEPVVQVENTAVCPDKINHVDTISFSTSYISDGFDLSILDTIERMFIDKRIHVTIQIDTV